MNCIESVQSRWNDMPIRSMTQGQTLMLDIDDPDMSSATLQEDGSMLVTQARISHAGEERMAAAPIQMPKEVADEFANARTAYAIVLFDQGRYVVIETERTKPFALAA